MRAEEDTALIPYLGDETPPWTLLGTVPDALSLPEALMSLGMVLTGNPRSDRVVVVDLAELSGLAEEILWREVISRCRFPAKWMVH